MSWFIKKSVPIKINKDKSRIPEGLWAKCPSCKEVIYRQELIRADNVCPKCGYHFRIPPRERLERLFDNKEFELLYNDL